VTPRTARILRIQESGTHIIRRFSAIAPYDTPEQTGVFALYFDRQLDDGIRPEPLTTEQAKAVLGQVFQDSAIGPCISGIDPLVGGKAGG
jgi:hypothetical protein